MTHKKKEDDSASKRWIACPIEEQYFGDQRKDSRKERKRRSEKDRSKFKKTDHTKFEKGRKKEIIDRREENELCRGRVLSITSQGFMVDHKGETYTCFLRGLLKREKTKHKNIVTVGDFVFFEPLPDREGYITNVEPRKSILSRADNLSRNKEQLIAANIDQVIITASVVSPQLKPSLIDRYIIAAKKGGMEPVIIINKIDLLDDDKYEAVVREVEAEILKECKEAYKHANIPLIAISVEKKNGIEQLKEVMKDKASVFSGQSGTGKSSIINAIAGLNLPVGETVHRTRKGSHTTTRAHLLPLEFGGWCIDTPGIKSFGVWDLSQEEVVSYFSEIQALGDQCKFPDCSHSHEGDCAVIAAFERGEISALRYESYLTLIETLQEEHRRR
jgi:ribosome biogenesis GTPase